MAKIALLIGISEYFPEFDPLPGAEKDVGAMKRILENEGIAAFDQVIPLLNPSREKMETEILRLFKNGKKDDLLLLYYSGHGVKDDNGTLYITSSVTRMNSLKATATSATYISECMKESRAKRQVLILDCCFSGAFLNVFKGAPISEDLTTELQRTLCPQGKFEGEGRVVLTASSSTQRAILRPNAELSVYTQYLIEGLETGAADQNNDGEISVDELHEYTRIKVRKAEPSMQPKMFFIGDSLKIKLAKTLQENSKSKYRTAVQRIAEENNGRIERERSYLDDLCQELGLAIHEAGLIEGEVLRFYSERRPEFQEPLSLPPPPLTHQLPLRDLSRFPGEDSSLEFLPSSTPATQIMSRHSLLKWIVFGGGGFLITIVVSRLLSNQLPLITESPKPTSTPPKPIAPIVPKSVTLQPLNFSTVLTNESGEETVQNKTVKFFVENLEDGVELEMIFVPGGQFLMGSPQNEVGRQPSEGEQRLVNVPDFFLGRFVVTQKQWKTIANLNMVSIHLIPDVSNSKGDDLPVEMVSWNLAAEFCARLSQLTRRTYRLPSEAEWEYACRANASPITPFHTGAVLRSKKRQLANYNATISYSSEPKGDFFNQTIRSGWYPPNALGLCDMHGNVWEWCQDAWHENYFNAPTDGSPWINGLDEEVRVMRGGSWENYSEECRSAARNKAFADDRSRNLGFRVACSASDVSIAQV